MSDPLPPVDELADELLAAIRDDPDLSLDPAISPQRHRVCAAYNRLYCELHDKVPAGEQTDE